jgi:hypothetical protein
MTLSEICRTVWAVLRAARNATKLRHLQSSNSRLLKRFITSCADRRTPPHFVRKLKVSRRLVPETGLLDYVPRHSGSLLLNVRRLDPVLNGRSGYANICIYNTGWRRGTFITFTIHQILLR